MIGRGLDERPMLVQILRRESRDPMPVCADLSSHSRIHFGHEFQGTGVLSVLSPSIIVS